MVVERSISFRNRFEFVIKINHYLTQWNVEMQFDTITADVFLLDEFTTFVKAKGHDRTYIVGISDDCGMDIRFLDMVNEIQFRQTRRIVHFLSIALLVIYHV